MARAWCWALVWWTLAEASVAGSRYADYSGAKMPQYGGGPDYEGPRDSLASAPPEDYADQASVSPTDYKYDDDSGKEEKISFKDDDIVDWPKNSKRRQIPQQTADEDNLEPIDRYNDEAISKLKPEHRTVHRSRNKARHVDFDVNRQRHPVKYNQNRLEDREPEGKDVIDQDEIRRNKGFELEDFEDFESKEDRHSHRQEPLGNKGSLVDEIDVKDDMHTHHVEGPRKKDLSFDDDDTEKEFMHKTTTVRVVRRKPRDRFIKRQGDYTERDDQLWRKRLLSSNRRTLDYPSENQKTIRKTVEYPSDNEKSNRKTLEYPSDNEKSSRRNLEFSFENEKPNRRNLELPFENEKPNRRNMELPTENEKPNRRNLELPSENEKPNRRNLEYPPEKEKLKAGRRRFESGFKEDSDDIASDIGEPRKSFISSAEEIDKMRVVGLPGKERVSKNFDDYKDYSDDMKRIERIRERIPVLLRRTSPVVVESTSTVARVAERELKALLSAHRLKDPDESPDSVVDPGSSPTTPLLTFPPSAVESHIDTEWNYFIRTNNTTRLYFTKHLLYVALILMYLQRYKALIFFKTFKLA